MSNSIKFTHRYLARIVIETQTPLAIGSGNKDMRTDSYVTRDVNGLPYIPGTTLAGILRSTLEENEQKLFGFQEKEKGEGSQISFTDAQIVDADGTVVEQLQTENWSKYLTLFKNLPIRQHVCMSDKGAAEQGGKFDKEVVFKGTRFCFEIEFVSEGENNKLLFEQVLRNLCCDTIRIGSGSRKGFGEIKIVECRQVALDLKNPVDLQKYLDKSSSLQIGSFWKTITDTTPATTSNQEWKTYTLTLTPDDFFLFGSGFGNEKADMTAVKETFFDWSSGKPETKKESILMPGSSIKGALSHRVAFHYNKLNKHFAGSPGVNTETKTGNGNQAVKAIFGYAEKGKKSEDKNEYNQIKRGNLLISDIIEETRSEVSKLLNHVSIDRFTGGAIDSALFSEEATYGNKNVYTLMIKVKKEAFSTDLPHIEAAFNAALNDIITGMLPLGGGTNRGHGCFSGTLTQN